MNQKLMDFLTWQELLGTEQACLEALAHHRWRGGFACLNCRHDQA